MAYVTNLTETDQEIPSLGITIPAGKAVEVSIEPNWIPSDLFKVTKTSPRSTEVVPPAAPVMDHAVITVEEN